MMLSVQGWNDPIWRQPIELFQPVYLGMLHVPNCWSFRVLLLSASHIGHRPSISQNSLEVEGVSVLHHSLFAGKHEARNKSIMTSVIPRLQLQLLVLWHLCHLLLPTKAESAKFPAICGTAYDIAQNVTCLQSAPCETNKTMQCSKNCYIDNCHHLCGNSSLGESWSSVNHLEECLLYANISQHLSASSPTDRYRQILTGDTSGNSDVTQEVVDNLAECLVDFCSLSLRCSIATVTGCTLQDLLLSDGSVNAEAVSHCKQSLCPNLVMNGDIFGIGVYIASTLQVMIALVFVSVSIALHSLYHQRSAKLQKLSSTTLMQADEVAETQRIERGLKKVEKAQRVVILTTASYQQAQCYYVMALTIATVYAIAPIGVIQLNELDQQALVFIAACNVFLTSIILMMALFNGRESVSNFSFYLSFLTWLGTLITSQFVYGSVPYYRAHSRTPGPQCSNESLLAICGTNFQLGSDRWLLMTAIVICLCFLAFFNEQSRRVWKHCSETFSRSFCGTSFNPHISSLTTRLQVLGRRQSPYNDWFRGMENKKFILKQLTISFAWVISLYLWADVLATPDFRRAIPTQWTFGQVMALTIWLPVLVEFASLTWAEFGDYQRHRIKRWLCCGRARIQQSTSAYTSANLVSLNQDHTYRAPSLHLPRSAETNPKLGFKVVTQPAFSSSESHLLTGISPQPTPSSPYPVSNGVSPDYFTTTPYNHIGR